jgi:hypothetical protein
MWFTLLFSCVWNLVASKTEIARGPARNRNRHSFRAFLHIRTLRNHKSMQDYFLRVCLSLNLAISGAGTQ